MSFDPRWEDIYRAGQQLNRYPFNDVVTFMHRYHDRTKPREHIRVLEIGCGAGNNLWFAAREGFDVYGIDGSASAIDYARNRFSGEGLKGDFRVGDFCELPYEDDCFDIVIDRGALTLAGRSGATRAVEGILRSLKHGGHFFSHVLGDEASLRGADIGDDLIELAHDKGFTVQTRIYNQQKIEELWCAPWIHRERVRISRESFSDGDTLVYWQVVVQKP